MSNFTSVVGVIAVSDHPASVAWYRAWIGRGPDVVPDEGVAEWQIVENAWIQVAADAANAGKGSVIIGVANIDTQVSALASAGVTAGEVNDLGFIKLVTVTDLDGNAINFVEEVEGYEAPVE